MRYPLLATVLLAFGLMASLPGVAAAAPPNHDNIASARVVPPGLGDTNAQATAEAGEPAHAGNPASHSVWFRYDATHNGQVQIDTCSSDIDTVIAIYTGGPDFGSLSLVAADDDGGTVGCTAGDSQITFVAAAGTTYRIAMDGKAGATGSYQLLIRAEPANADFADATTLHPVFASTGGTNFFAGKEAGEPDHAGDAGGNSFWFEWTPAGDGTVDIDTCGSSFDTLLAVYTGDSVNALTPVADNDDAVGCDPGDTGSRISFAVQSGTTYRIAVDGKAGVQGQYALLLDGPPPNDLFASAEDLGNSSNTAGGDNRHAAKQAGEPAHAGDSGGHSVWYRWTPSLSGPVSLNTCGSSFDTLLAVYTGTTIGALTEVESDDDGGEAGCLTGNSLLTFNASAGTTYRIAIDGKGGAGGGVQLDLNVPPPSDDFVAAEPIGGDSVTTGVDLIAATKEVGEPAHAGVPGGQSVWYRWTATVSGSVDLDACANDYDTVLAVYTGNTLAGLTEVEANDDDGTDPDCSNPTDSGLSFAAVAGTTYRIAIDAKAPPVGNNGNFSLYLAGPADAAAPDTTVLSGPTVSASPNVAFTYAAVPAFDVSVFECRLDSDDVADFQPCPDAGMSFTGLTDGAHRFDVRAIDFDANVDPSPATRSFTVDTIAPDTSILDGPSGTIETASASFTYTGSADASDFECRLDGAGFAACPAEGKTFAGLAIGSHEFAVRSRDAAGNIDASPAERAFTVAAPVVVPPPATPDAPDNCTPARDRLDQAKAKLKSAKRKLQAADGAKQIAAAQKKVKKAKEKVAKAKDAVAEACSP